MKPESGKKRGAAARQRGKQGNALQDQGTSRCVTSLEKRRNKRRKDEGVRFI